MYFIITIIKTLSTLSELQFFRENILKTTFKEYKEVNAL